MRRGTPSLRRIATTVMAVVAGLIVLLAGSLLVVSAQLHRTTDILGGAVESVRLAEEAEVELLRHARATNPTLRAELQRTIRGHLRQAGTFVLTAEEAQRVGAAQNAVEDYFKTGDSEAAYDALEALSDAYVSQAQRSQARAAGWQMVGDLTGLIAGVLCLLLLAVVVWYVHARAIRPLFDLVATLRRFGGGDRGARAQEMGPSEVRAMASQFNEMADSLANQREAQMAFLAGVAHDLRNPLNALRLSVGSVREADVSRERTRMTLEIVDRQVSRLDRMISDFLDMARIEAGDLELQLDRVDARDVIRRVVELFEGVCRDHQLAVTVTDDPVPLLCDPLRIEQVLGNLVSNAIKYSPGGGRIEVTLARGEGWAELVVTDQGVGIAEADLPRLFEPFRRAGTSAQMVAIPGAGLGLFVVRRIVEAHAGRIDVQSTPGQGSLFRVRLPLLEGAAMSATPLPTA